MEGRFPSVWCVSVEGKTWGLLVTAARSGLFLLFEDTRKWTDSSPPLLRSLEDLQVAEVVGVAQPCDLGSSDPRKPSGPESPPGSPQCSTLSPSLPALDTHPTLLCLTQNKPWKKLKTVLKYSPFMVSFRKHYPWVQLSGHAGESRGVGAGRGQRSLGWGKKAPEPFSIAQLAPSVMWA